MISFCYTKNLTKMKYVVRQPRRLYDLKILAYIEKV